LRTKTNFWKLCFVLSGAILLIITGCKKATEPVYGSTVTDIDGNVYQTVIIGTQTWMIENLKTTHYNDSTSIPLITDSITWINMITPGYCWYNNASASNKATYGALYNWYVVNTGKLAPKGWHVPTDNEWNTLENNVLQYYHSSGSLSKILASASHWRTSTSSGAVGNNLSTNNSSGFSAIPGGYRISKKYAFNKIDSVGAWWNSTSVSDTTSQSIMLKNDLSTIERVNSKRQCGFSVRCLKN
jgi:uncharacterized protein (TIGR02145 family)